MFSGSCFWKVTGKGSIMSPLILKEMLFHWNKQVGLKYVPLKMLFWTAVFSLMEGDFPRGFCDSTTVEYTM